jgi:Family of unknown function (DUF6317)
MVMDAGFEVVRSRLLVAAGAFGTESVTFWAIMSPGGPAVDRSGSPEFDAALVRLLAEIGRRHTQLAAAIAGHGCRLREARNGYRTAEQTVGAMIDQMMDPDVPG